MLPFKAQNYPTLGELKLQNRISIGSYVKLPHSLNTFKVLPNLSGCKDTQNITILPHQSVLAQFTGEEDNGFIKFIGRPSSFKIRLEGKKCYDEGKRVLESICKKMFNNYGIFAHAITEEDFDNFKDLILSDAKSKSNNFFLSPSKYGENKYGFNVAVICDNDIQKKFFATYDSKTEEIFSLYYSVCPIIKISSDILIKTTYENESDGQIKSPFHLITGNISCSPVN